MRQEVRSRIGHRSHDLLDFISRGLVLLDAEVVDEEFAGNELSGNAGDDCSGTDVHDEIEADLQVSDPVDLMVTRDVVEGGGAHENASEEHPYWELFRHLSVPIA